jgi:hypothetical protein
VNSTTWENLTSENITAYWTAYDVDNHNVYNITDWRRDGASLTVLNVPFEGGSTSSWTKDYSSYDQNLTVVGPTYQPTGSFDGSGTYDFDGSNDYINAGPFNPTNPHNITMMAWFYNEGLTFESCCYVDYIIGKGPDNADDTYGLFLSSPTANLADGGPSLVVNDDGGLVYAGKWGDIDVGEWHHVAGVIEGNNLSMYLDGVLAASNTISGTINTNSYQVWIGAQNRGSYSYYFNGNIDDVRMYDRALSPEQIYEIYANRSEVIVNNETKTGDI